MESRRSMDPVLQDHIKKEEEHDLRQDERLKKIEDDVAEIKTSIKGLLDAWNAAGTVGNFLKWIAGLWAGWMAFSEFFKMIGK